jgi:hypothetical protein
MQTHVKPRKPLAALCLLLLLAAAPLQQAGSVGLGTPAVTGANSKGGTLRDTPDEEGQAAEDAPQNQDAGDASAEAPDEAQPEAASDETSEPTDQNENPDGYDPDEGESEDSDDEDE